MTEDGKMPRVTGLQEDTGQIVKTKHPEFCKKTFNVVIGSVLNKKDIMMSLK
jgi:hypothetical protein